MWPLHAESIPAAKLSLSESVLMFYVRATLLALWFALSCAFAFAWSLLRWKNPNATYQICRFWGFGGLRICNIKLKLENEDVLYRSQPCVYVANHQNIFDILIFGAIFPRNTAVVFKRELLKIPFFGWFLYAGGHIPIERQKKERAIAKLDTGVEAIAEQKKSIFVFPEGTRNRTDTQLQAFKKGAFHMAVQAQVAVVPLIADEFRHKLNLKGRKIDGGVVHVRVLEPVSTQGYNDANVDALVGTVRDAVLEGLNALQREFPQ